MASIFLNFRVSDGNNPALRIDRDLTIQFGEHRVFRSSRSIPLGTEFDSALLKGVRTASVVLVVIGPAWLDVVDHEGRRRIDNPDDWVRREIAEALQSNKIIIPLLDSSASMPSASDLPPDIADLAKRQYKRIDYRTADQDIATLINDLINLVPDLGIGVVDGLEDLSNWLDNWRYLTDPPIPESLPTLGREREIQSVLAWLDTPASILTVRAPARTEAAAFVATVARDDRPGLRAVYVSSPAAWQRCQLLSGSLLIVVDFPGVVLSTSRPLPGHIVLVNDVADGTRIDLDLPRIPRDKATEAFAAIGLAPATASQYAGIARRSLSSFRRRLSRTNITPAWAKQPVSDLVTPLVLAGRWADSSPADRAELTELTGYNEADIDRFLTGANATDDPLLHRSGGRWQLVDPHDAWSLLHRRLSAADLERWRSVADKVLGETDPALGIPADEQLYAGVRGHTRRWSDELRHGLAQGAALLGAAGATNLAGGTTAADHAAGFVQDLLQRANDDSSGLLWQSLADVLPLLAEAAPSQFLEAVDTGLAGEPALLLTMFADGADTPTQGTGRFSPHTGLLWALEALCWSEDDLPMVISVLSSLAHIDPGGRTSNRPAETLTLLLQVWYPYLDIAPGRREDLVDAICRRSPEVGWSLVLDLLSGPQGHLLMAPHRPEVRHDWAIPESPVPAGDLAGFQDHLLELALTELDMAAKHWTECLTRTLDLTFAQWSRAVDALNTLELAGLADEDRFELWNQINRFIGRHRQFAGATWALPEELLKRFEHCAATVEPPVNPRRQARLFTWHPYIEGTDRFDLEANNAQAEKLRKEALTAVLRDHGVQGLVELAEASDVPWQVGVTTALVAGDNVQDEMLPLLEASELASGWVWRMAYDKGEEWSTEVAKKLGSQSAGASVAFLLTIPKEHAIHLLDLASEDVTERYWSRVGAWPLPAGSEEHFFDMLLTHRRPWAAIDSLSLSLTGPDALTPPTSTIQSTLFLALEGNIDAPNQHSPYAAGKLLDFLAENSDDKFKIAQLELLYQTALKHHRKSHALYRILTEDPDQFVDLYCVAHPTDGSGPTGVLINAWFALFEMRTLPGSTSDGLDGQVLKEWVTRARAGFHSKDRASAGDEAIGTVLSGSPVGKDGAWPAEPVRDILDGTDAKHLRNGFATGTFNNRGMTVRDSYEGGDQERDLAQRYGNWAKKIDVGWPRVAKLLRDYADRLRREARRNDDSADEIHDTP